MNRSNSRLAPLLAVIVVSLAAPAAASPYAVIQV